MFEEIGAKPNLRAEIFKVKHGYRVEISSIIEPIKLDNKEVNSIRQILGAFDGFKELEDASDWVRDTFNNAVIVVVVK